MNKLYGLDAGEMAKLNEILDVLTIQELFDIATGVRTVQRRGFGAVRLIVSKGTVRPDLSRLELPLAGCEEREEK